MKYHYLLFAMSVRGILNLKDIFNNIIVSLLAFITASDIAGTSVSNYLFTTANVLIMIAIVSERLIVERNKYFRFFRTIESYNNSTAPFRPVIYYNKWTHIAIMICITLLNLLKIICATYLVVTLSIYHKTPKRYLLMLISTFTLFESTIGTLLYLPSTFALIFVKKAYYEFINVIRRRYYERVLDSKLYFDGDILVLEANAIPYPRNNGTEMV